MDKLHIAASGANRLSSVNLDFNTIGRVSSPRASSANKSSPKSGSPANKSSPRASPANKSSHRIRYNYPLVPSPRPSPVPSPRPSPIPPIKYRNSLVPSPRPSSVPSPVPSPIIRIKTSPGFSPKKPSKLSLVKPQTPVAKPVKPTNLNKIHPVIPTGQVGLAEQAQVVANKKFKLPDKFLAIYYVDLIYETIKKLSLVILELIKVVGTQHPIFKQDAVSKLESMIKDIDKDRYMYLPRDIKDKKKINIKELYLYVKILIKKPQDKFTFAIMMTAILDEQGIDEYKIRMYISNVLNMYTHLQLKMHISWQYLNLTSDIIRFASKIDNRGVSDKLQSLQVVMANFIDIINNIFNDIEPTSTFSGGLVLFPNFRYNKDDNEYTPLVNKYIDANANNFKNIYEYFKTTLKYFHEIINIINNVDYDDYLYFKEYKNVVTNDPSNQYKQDDSGLTLSERTARLMTKRAINVAQKRFEIIDNKLKSKVVKIKEQLDNMNEIIKETQEETDELYHKLD
jgi:hypothetical protein